MKRAAICLGACVLAGVGVVSAQVSGPPVAQSRSSSGVEAASAPSMRFAYVGANWSTVLADVAKAGGYELVMPFEPRGRFERYDLREVTTERAIAIVNEQLAEQRIRVTPQGRFLLVLRDNTFRATYPRYHYGTATSDAKGASNEPTRPSKKKFAGVTTAGHEADGGSAAQSLPAQRPVRRTSFEQPVITRAEAYSDEDRVEPLFPKLQPIETSEPRREATVVEPRRLRASVIAKTVYEALGDAATLVDEGPLGLPSFEVATLDGESRPVRWAVGVDVTEDRLIIDAPEATSEQLVQLFEEIDQQTGRGPIRLAQADPAVHSAAVGLGPIVESMLAMQAADGVAGDNGQAPSGQQVVEGADAEDITRILDRLRSNVTVESLDELGLLILRGNEADVEAVMQIIDAIEKQSVGTTPEVHLRILGSVDSTAMSELLNGVYESVQSIETRPGRDDKRVNVIPVVRPNAILIVAPSVELPSILDLVDNLDKPVDPETELRVFRLNFTDASQAVETLNEFYADRGGLGTRVRVSADPRTNSLIVQARPNDLAEVSSLLAKIDRADGGSVNRMQLFPLKNAVASELADFLNAAIEDVIEPRQTGGARAGQAGQQNRSIVLEFLESGEAAAELLRSGVLEDVRITADPRTNTLAVIAPERSLPLFAAVIDSLDRPAAAAIEVKVFTLSNADASAAVTLLNELFEQEGTEEPVGVQLSGANDSASNLLPVKFSVDVRTNSIVATGGPDALTVVEAILLRLDAGDGRERTTRVLRLRNSRASDVATAINEFLESQRELNASNPDLVSTVELLEREVIIVPEDVSNNLLISATDAYYDDIVRIATELDAQLQQVIVQAMLVEVTLENADEFGVELGFQDSVLFDRGLSTETAITSAGSQTVLTAVREPGFRFGDLQTFPNLGNVPVNPGTVGGQGLSNFALGRVSDLGFGGLVLSASSEAVSTLIRALALNREVHVLSRPQIRTVDGQQAQIQVGQLVPIINGVNVNQFGQANPQIQYDEAGLILDVTPRITPDGEIVMEVIAERSFYDLTTGVPVFIDTTSGSTIESPIKDITVARSTVSVANGQTIVLGGLITQRNENETRKVPWLGDLPLIGHAFRYDQRSDLRTELLIFLTPRVISTDYDNSVIKDVEAGRLHWFREQAESVHGPIFDVHEPAFAPGMMLPGPDEMGGEFYAPGPEVTYPPIGPANETVVGPQVEQFVPTPVPPTAAPAEVAP